MLTRKDLKISALGVSFLAPPPELGAEEVVSGSVFEVLISRGGFLVGRAMELGVGVGPLRSLFEPRL